MTDLYTVARTFHILLLFVDLLTEKTERELNRLGELCLECLVQRAVYQEVYGSVEHQEQVTES